MINIKKLFIGIVTAIAGLALFASSVSAASYTLFDDASIVGGGNPINAAQVTSDATPGWGGIDFTIPAGLTFADLSHLMTDYKVTTGDCGGGAPRFQINIDGKNVFVYIGPLPNFTGCTLNSWLTTEDFIGSGDTVFDLSQFGGPFYGTYAQTVALLGTHTITGIQLVVDGGWSVVGGNQTVLFDNVKINGDVYTFDPEPKLVDHQKVDFYHVTGGSSDNVLTESPYEGHLSIVDPMGNNDIVIEGMIKGLTPNTQYYVWIRNLDSNGGYTGDFIQQYAPLGYYSLLTFKTNKQGIGNFHYNINDFDLPDGTYNIQIAINEGYPIGVTVAATIKYMDVIVD